MTDRHAGYIVVLKKDMREDDAEATIVALRCIRGVVSVKPVIADPGTMIAESRARASLVDKLFKLINEVQK